MSRIIASRSRTAVVAVGLALGVTLVAGVGPASAAPKSSGAVVVDGGKLDGGKLDGGKLDGGKLDGGKLDGGKLDQQPAR